ncbi:MAG: SpoIVB peptidase [Cellulosilyticaceae bacterium]
MKQRKQYTKISLVMLITILMGGYFISSYYDLPNIITVITDNQNSIKASPMNNISAETVSVEAVSVKEVIPSGEIIGVRVLTKGIHVIGVSEVYTQDGSEKPCKDKVKKGDIILQINDIELKSKEQFKEIIEANGDKAIKIVLERNGDIVKVQVHPVYSQEDNKYKLGLWIKDGTQGVGTMTYIDPENNTYGALGHGITVSETKKLLPIKEGELTTTKINSIKKGEIGKPGQLCGAVSGNLDNKLGEVRLNSALGIYGILNDQGKKLLDGKRVPVGLQSEVHEGAATILLNLDGDGVKEYDIYIQKVTKYTSEPAKGMVIKIVDKRLLELTNGIVQGMSGSPIIQDEKIIGAVTHVFVQDPTKGYGIFIENMLNNDMK